MKFAVASLLLVVAFLSAGSNAKMSCYNATALPDMEKVFITLLFGGDVSEYEPNPGLPQEYDVVEDCDACMRLRIRMAMNTSAFQDGTTTTTTSTTTTPGQFSFGLAFPTDIEFNLTAIMWTCVKNEPGAAQKKKEDDLFTALGLGMMMANMENTTGMNLNATDFFSNALNEISSTDYDAEDQCVPMSFAMRPEGGAIQMCQCCYDKCTYYSDCGARFEYADLLPAPRDVNLYDAEDKCRFLRQSAYVINEVCDWVDTYDDPQADSEVPTDDGSSKKRRK